MRSLSQYVSGGYSVWISPGLSVRDRVYTAAIWYPGEYCDRQLLAGATRGGLAGGSRRGAGDGGDWVATGGDEHHRGHLYQWYPAHCDGRVRGYRYRHGLDKQ